MSKVIFITGATKGFGRIWAEELLDLGDRVIATGRNMIDNPNPPLRLLLGSFAYSFVKNVYKERLAGFEEWKEVSIDAHGK